MNFMEDHEVYSAIGEDGFARLISGFYRRVPQDEILGRCTGITIWKAPKNAYASF